MHVVDFPLAPSRLYMFIFAVIIWASILVLVGLPILVWLKMVAIVVVITHGYRVFWRYALLRDKLSITAIRYTEDKRWVVQNREGTFAAQLLPGSTVTTVLMLLHFRVSGRLLPLKSVILRDSLPPEEFRRLLVCLSV